ncbi:MAG: Nif3-like dinuclear metal center hexameric protein [Cyclobacteriaceae bacterium]
MRISEITRELEKIAPPSYQETYDNSGLLIGHHNTEVSGVLITLDVTEEVMSEALTNDCNLIIAHHPLIFKGLKRINGDHWVERCILTAIKKDIAIYAIHTNLDNVIGGVNAKIAGKLGLVNTKVLSPKPDLLSKLVTYVPETHAEEVTQALYNSGAGEIGNYNHSSYQSDGIGRFRPGENTDSFIGKKGKETRVNEKRIEVILPDFKSKKILNALLESHPYEEVAYYLTSLKNANQEVGSGMIGELEEPMEISKFLSLLKDKMKTGVVRHTKTHKDQVKKIAVCGGSGSFLLKQAIMAEADVFVSADFKYHEFFEADNRITIADIGHYESEQFTKDLLYDILSEKLTNIALRLSEVQTNPIKYL